MPQSLGVIEKSDTDVGRHRERVVPTLVVIQKGGILWPKELFHGVFCSKLFRGQGFLKWS